MYLAHIICSDQDCAAETIVEAESIVEIMSLACECGCAVDVIGWPDGAAPVFGPGVILH